VPLKAGSQVQWDEPPSDPQLQARDFEQDAQKRAMLLHEWLHNLSHLVEFVNRWAKELGWSTKQIEKPMEDSEIGDYEAPALLLQEETTRVLLEPIGRSAPGAEGLVDLYLMPAYDDIASLYFYGNRWNLYYMAPGTRAVADIRESESKPLTKAALAKVLHEMRKNAQ
jgi:hypothetical protein